MDLQSYEAVTCSLIYDLQLGRSPNVFSCGESNANELEQRVLLIYIRFGTWKVLRRLNYKHCGYGFSHQPFLKSAPRLPRRDLSWYL